MLNDLLEILGYIDPAALDYQEWVNVGMALKHEGFTAEDWERWSASDTTRYHPGECKKKWKSFGGSSSPVTGGTLVALAKEHGYDAAQGYELEWDDTIGKSRDDGVIIDKNWIEGHEISEPVRWDPVEQLTRYLSTLFEASETVGYVTETWEKDGKFFPTKGAFDRTAGELIELLSKCGGDVGSVIGDVNPGAGAWIRFNPLDGKGVKNENVTDYRYALVESDSTDLDKQNAIIRELELPCAMLVYSGKKSLHAIVRVEAANYEEYRKRVDFLYALCKKNGLCIDSQNRNPSRLSRMPGIMRGDKKQFIVDSDIGKGSWNEWREWIDSVNDDLPDPESMSDVWDDLPPLSPPLIEGILRQGHKMLLAGPSKAGKSYALIELCIAIAEGRSWLGFQCTQGRVLYVNLELDRASCLHRFRDVYTALKLSPQHLDCLDIWNLRGKTIPMDKLAPKLIRRAHRKDYIAIVIDPIYKVITGDENSADQMAHFCNQFDKVCTELGCAVIYCHHHSKGAQGGKRSMDRASGSGVFARDPDALLDLIQLDTPKAVVKAEEERGIIEICKKYLLRFNCDFDDCITCDDFTGAARSALNEATYKLVSGEISSARERLSGRTAWRIEGTLREYPRFAPVNCWFDYPVHILDTAGVLKALYADDGYTAKGSPYKGNFSKKRSVEKRQSDKNQSFNTAFEMCKENGTASISELAEYLGTTEKTVRNRAKETERFWVEDGKIGLKSE